MNDDMSAFMYQALKDNIKTQMCRVKHISLIEVKHNFGFWDIAALEVEIRRQLTAFGIPVH